MINDDVLIKLSRKQLGHSDDWPEFVISLKKRIREIKLGFPGIKNNHLSIINVNNLNINDTFIIDDYFGKDNIDFTDNAPLMLKILEKPKHFLIEGIGIGTDINRDPYRLNFRWKDIIYIDNLERINNIVFRVDVKPDSVTGGPGYYYFFKSYRDFRL